MAKKLEKDYSYPETNDPDFISKIFRKREFYYHKIPIRDKMKNYEEIQKYREENCPEGEFELRNHQKILTNFINQNTPYNGVLLMYGTGTGKTATAISIAEQFKIQVKKYNTKIFVLVPGPNTRETWKSELLFTTGETYLKNKEIINQYSKYEADRERKIAVYAALQYYKILSYKTFYKKVLGEKIRETTVSNDNKIVTNYKRKESGEFEREIVIDKINNMDNSILIVDEAHNLTGSSSKNEYGKALKHIIEKSENLKVILLSATPMKNLATDIIDLLNFIKPKNEQIKKEDIFTNEKEVHLIKFKPNGKDKLKEQSRGYISFFRGNTPYTFAERIDKGEIPPSMLFTPVVRCFMENFQLKTYKKTNKLKNKLDRKDTLFKSSSAAANFVFPILDSNKKDIIGAHSTDGLNKLISLLSSDKRKLISKINKSLFNNKLGKYELENFIYENERNSISGSILNIKYLKHFSIKFYKCLNRLNKLNDSNKGSGTAFIYSNLVKAGGMELFADTLIENGYLEYNNDPKKYEIKDNTIDYLSGLTYAQYKKRKKDITLFYPATFILITGGVDDSGEDIPEIKQKIIRQVFNSYENRNGKLIKFVLGSMVMNEGVTLENVKEIHILDVHYNLGKVEQVIGRGIRMCKHQAVITDTYRFPQVNVYRYVVSLKNTLSTDEILYKKAEKKYLLVKETERALKEVAIDCPLLLHGNKFPEEIEKYKNCVPPTLENIKKKKIICPAMCDFTSCELKCNDPKLNKKYWNNNKKTYKNIQLNNIDYKTFNDDLAKFEIDNIKNKIKDLYRFKHVYNYDEISEIIKKSYTKFQSELFDNYFLDQALENLMPKNENDFNNFTSTVYDKYNRQGYLIQRDEYYIFQPFDENEKVPLYYRKNLKVNEENKVNVGSYIRSNFKNIKEIKLKETIKTNQNNYDFDTTLDYYEDRDENFIVGIIDKNKNKLASQKNDLFKIRPTRAKILDKKRGTGIPTLKGAVCSTSKDKNYLIKILNKLPKYHNIIKIKNTRDNLCKQIKNNMLYLEKYSLSKNKNKITYIIIPANHHTFPFPYNLEDRIKFTIKNIKKILNRDINMKVKKMKNGIFLNERNINYAKYELEFKNNKYTKNNSKKLLNLGFKLENNLWKIIIE
jgi:hypothetical protein